MSKSKKAPRTQEPPPIPKAQTLWRLTELSGELDNILLDMERRGLSAAIQSPEAMQAIRDAATPQQLVFLAKDARGAAMSLWRERMHAFGPSALPAVVRRLQSSQSIRDEDEREIVVERLIGVIGALGEGSGDVLLGCFNNLDIYGQSLACIALGHLHVAAARDVIWRYFERVRYDDDIGYTVGALWGMVELPHPYTDEALTDLLEDGRWFPEQYGLVARAGGPLCVAPLIHRLVESAQTPNYSGEPEDVLMALAGILSRVGEEVFRPELITVLDSEARAQQMIEGLHKRTSHVPRYFEMFFK